MSTIASAAPQPQGPGLSEGARIINIFVAPSKTFADLNRKASWFVPFVLLALVSYGFVFAASQKVGWTQLTENQINNSSFAKEQLEKLPPAQYQAAMARAAVQTKVISYAIPVFALLIYVIVAGVMLFSMNFMAGGNIKFGAAMAVVVYAWLPSIIKAALAVVSLYAGANIENFSFQNPVASSPAYLLKPGTPLFALASGLDIFSIWICILLAIGFSRISKLKIGTTSLIVFAWYAIVVLFGVGVAAIFS